MLPETLLLLKATGAVVALAGMFFTYVVQERLRRGKYNLKQELIYKLENYKLFRKSEKEVSDVEEFKDKILKVLIEGK